MENGTKSDGYMVGSWIAKCDPDGGREWQMDEASIEGAGREGKRNP